MPKRRTGGLSRSLGGLWRLVRREHKADAFLVVVILSVIAFAAAQLWSEVRLAVTAWFGSERMFNLVMLGAGLISLLAYVIWKRVFQPDQGLRQLERLRAVPIETEAQLREIQEGVVADIFGSYTPPDEEVYRIFRKNPRRSIGLYSDDEGAFVGFASIWPITAEAANAIKRGERVEEDLTIDDIIPADQNMAAEFAVIPGIAVLPNDRGETEQRGVRLILAFGKFIGNEYLSGRGRSIEIIASAFSRDGLAMCRKFEMTPLGTFSHSVGRWLWFFPKGKRMPLFHRRFTLADVRREQKHWT